MKRQHTGRVCLDCHRRAALHPADSAVQRCYAGAGALIGIGAVSTVLSTLAPGTIPDHTHSFTLLAGAVATHIARRMDNSSSKSEEP